MVSIVSYSRLSLTNLRMQLFEALVQEDLKKWTFNGLRHCVSAGEPLNEEVIYNWEEGTHLVIKEGYGQTETTLLLGTFKVNFELLH